MGSKKVNQMGRQVYGSQNAAASSGSNELNVGTGQQNAIEGGSGGIAAQTGSTRFENVRDQLGSNSVSGESLNERREELLSQIRAELNAISTTSIGSTSSTCNPRSFSNFAGGAGSTINNRRRKFQVEFAEATRLSNTRTDNAGFKNVVPDMKLGSAFGTLQKLGDKEGWGRFQKRHRSYQT